MSLACRRFLNGLQDYAPTSPGGGVRILCPYAPRSDRESSLSCDTVDARHPEWWFGEALDPRPNSNALHFEGIMAHEWAMRSGLFDTDIGGGGLPNTCQWNTPAQHTMCAVISSYTQSFNIRSLQQDDIDSANDIYP